MNLDELTNRLKKLEKQTKRCCSIGITFKDTLDDFPDIGVVNHLYINKLTSVVYIWNGEGYSTADSVG